MNDFGSEPFLIEIGDRVTITHGCVILTHDGSTCLMIDEKGRRQSYGRVIIGNDVFVGINSIIMPGVTIGNRCVVGAGSVVTKSLSDGSVVAGNPAKYQMSFDDFINRGLEVYPADGDFKHCTFREKVLKMVSDKPKVKLDTNK